MSMRIRASYVLLVTRWFIGSKLRLNSHVAYFLDGLISLNIESPR